MTKQQIEKEIFFHVGLGKTGTTFLQYRVFPYFQGIQYIQRTKYKKSKEIIKDGESSKYLLSREFDHQFEEEVKWFAQTYPDTTPIVVFRRQDSYIASQYRRFTKNGFNLDFDAFINLDDDSGFFKIKDLDYGRHIKILEDNFNKKPIVLIYDDLKNDPKKFVTDLANRLGVTIDINKVDFSTKHSSYSEKQLKAIAALSEKMDLRKRRIFDNGLLHLLSRLYMSIFRYGTLYTAKILPDSLFSEEPLIDPKKLERVREYFADDWEETKNYAYVEVS